MINKRRAYIFLNGEMNIKNKFYEDILKNEDGDIYCADGGAKYCLELNKIPKEIWGDFDSIEEEKLQEFEEKGSILKKFPSHKDFTDGELIIEYVHKKKYQEIFILGGLGGRLDHQLTNINLLSKYENIYILTEKELVFFVGKKYTINNRKNHIVSFIPMSDKVTGLTLKGFEYPLDKYVLKRGDSRCISNILIQDQGQISYETGELICIINI